MKTLNRQDHSEHAYTLTHIRNFPPFARDAAGRSKGLAIEILEAAFSSVKVKGIFIPEDLERIQDLVRDGKAHGIAVFAINPERMKIYDYSDPYIVTGAGLFVKRCAFPDFSLTAYNGKTVCTPLKGPLTEFIERSFPHVRLQTVNDYPAALTTVLEDGADAAALNIHVAASLVDESFPNEFLVPDRPIFKNELAVAALKGENSAMLKQVSRGLEIIKTEGVYKQIIKRWSHLDKVGLWDE